MSFHALTKEEASILSLSPFETYHNILPLALKAEHVSRLRSGRKHVLAAVWPVAIYIYRVTRRGERVRERRGGLRARERLARHPGSGPAGSCTLAAATTGAAAVALSLFQRRFRSIYT